MNSLDFNYQGGEAGAFEDIVYPQKEGPVRYEPYRSGSHFKMITAIEKEGFANIEFSDGGTLRRAKVSLSEYGVLNILTLT